MVRLFKKESEIIDYTDRGKNIPEIKSRYGITKEGYVVVKENFDETKIMPAASINNINASSYNNSAFDFLNNTSSANSDSSSNNTSFSSPFDFLDNTANTNVNNNNNNELSAGSSDQILELKKIIESLSFQSEQNSSETYQLMQRIQLLERKIGRLIEKV